MLQQLYSIQGHIPQKGLLVIFSKRPFQTFFFFWVNALTKSWVELGLHEKQRQRTTWLHASNKHVSHSGWVENQADLPGLDLKSVCNWVNFVFLGPIVRNYVCRQSQKKKKKEKSRQNVFNNSWYLKRSGSKAQVKFDFAWTRNPDMGKR